MALITKLDKWFGSGERWHEIGVIHFWAFPILGLMAPLFLLAEVITQFINQYFSWFPILKESWPIFMVLSIINFGRVFCHELGRERGWDFRSAVRDPDWYYDQFVRPLGSTLWAGILLYVPMNWWWAGFIVAFLFSYKWKIFERK